jgi:hypothetical protein
VVAACGGSASPAALPDGAFRIRLARTIEAGDGWREQVSHRLDRSVVVRREGDVVARETERRAAAYDADVRVLAVTRHGDALERELVVRRFDYSVDGVPGPPLPEGARVRVISALDGAGVIERIDGELSVEAVRALRALAGTRVRPANDDDAFGTSRPRRIGERWPIRTLLVGRELESVGGIRIAEDGLRGASRLVEATQRAGIDCLEIETLLEARLAAVPVVRADVTLDEAVLRVQMRACHPLDARVPVLARESVTVLTTRGHTADGEIVEVSAATRERARSRPR